MEKIATGLLIGVVLLMVVGIVAFAMYPTLSGAATTATKSTENDSNNWIVGLIAIVIAVAIVIMIIVGGMRLATGSHSKK
jgi:uncharacterized BrkB/YihY/UPF0761 family membrane protein